jgi:23S rRNA pseudouridine2605 synthase
MQRLSKVLAACGIASRRAAEVLIKEGAITVNGRRVLEPQTLCDIEQDSICYKGKRVQKEDKAYYLLHKPVGYTCTNAPLKSKKRAVDLIESSLRLFTVGRLDKDSSGLIIVTNDGHFANKIMHPSNEIPKEYVVKVDKEIQHEHLVAIAEGCWVDGAFVKPFSVTKVRRGTLKVVILDGRKREIRCIMEHVGLEVLSLKRVRIGNLVLGKLEVGASRQMTEREKTRIFCG